MSIIKYTADELVSQLGPSTPVPVPIGSPVSNIRIRSIPAQDGTTRTGLWECTPGRWRRQVVQAEDCYFLEGECTFTPDNGEPIEIRAGDALYFPANTTGIWDVRSLAKKIYVVYG